MKTKLLWFFAIIFTMIAVSSCNVQKKLDKVQPSQDIAKNKELNEIQPSQDDNKKNKKFIPYISRAAVKEETTVCYREGRNLMCKSGSNAPVTIAKNVDGQFMLFHQTVYYFKPHYFKHQTYYHRDLYKTDINSQQDTLMICGDAVHLDDAPFIGAYKNSIYLILDDIDPDEDYEVGNHILLVTENKIRELYRPRSTYFTAILDGQLFFVADNPDLSEDNQIIYKIDLDKEEKSVETITTCRLPKFHYTEYVQNNVLADYNNNVIYCLNMLDYYPEDPFEVEIMRIDKTGAVESLITKKEPIGLSFPMNGNVVYYCKESQIYEQMGQKFFNLGTGEWAKQIFYHKKKCYWHETYGDIYCYDGEEFFPLIDVNNKYFCIYDMTVIGQTLYFCCEYDDIENYEEIGFSMPLRKLHKKEQRKFSKELEDYKKANDWGYEEVYDFIMVSFRIEKELEDLIKALPDK